MDKKKKAPIKKNTTKKPTAKKLTTKKAPAKPTKGKKIGTLQILAAVSILLAVLLLAGSLPGLIPLLRGQAAVSDASELSTGSYVRLEVDNILGIYAENYNTSRPNTVTAYIAVMKLGGQLVSVRLPMSLSDGANTLLQQTLAQYQSGAGAPTKDILVYGTVAKLDDKTSGLLYTWYNSNSFWLSSAGLTSSSADPSTVLSNYMIKADFLGGYPNLWSFWTVFSAALFFIAAAFVLALVGWRLAAPKKISSVSEKKTEKKAEEKPKKKDPQKDHLAYLSAYIAPKKKDEKNGNKDENGDG